MISQPAPRQSRAIVRSLSAILCVWLATDSFGVSLFLSPVLPSATVGAEVQFDLSVSGLDAPGPVSIGAFDLTVQFPSDLLVFKDFAFGDDRLGDQLAITFPSATGLSHDAAAGTVSAFEISLDSPDTLNQSQGAGFALGRLRFQAVGPGTGALSISSPLLGDSFGDLLVNVEVSDISVTVSPVGLPESGPGFLVLSIAAIGLTLLHRSIRRHDPSVKA